MTLLLPRQQGLLQQYLWRSWRPTACSLGAEVEAHGGGRWRHERGRSDCGHIGPWDHEEALAEPRLLVVVAHKELAVAPIGIIEATRFDNAEGHACTRKESLGVELPEEDIVTVTRGRRRGAHGRDQSHALAAAAASCQKCSHLVLHALKLNGLHNGLWLRAMHADGDGKCLDPLEGRAHGIGLGDVTHENALASVAARASEPLPRLGHVAHQGTSSSQRALLLQYLVQEHARAAGGPCDQDVA
mmetsp:Transcript_66371/g.154229  ORF Transcript_66371/g.154229 Transcript_66371/m.154229 type:complete len:244 (+) Transcript_66371:74-805(+)